MSQDINVLALVKGAERYVFELTGLLEKHGHEVIPFAMEHEKNYPSIYSDYFVKKIDYPELLKQKPDLGTQLRLLERLLYSSEAKENITRLIRDVRPDVVHIHGISHEMSPSILDAIKSFQIPTVQTVHDYVLLCPNTSFISQDEVCERCKKHRYYNVVLHRCKRNSYRASLLACLEHYFQNVLNIYEKNIDLFIAPGKYLQNK